MTALVGLTLGVFLGIIFRELWVKFRLPPATAEQICRELAEGADEQTKAALRAVAEHCREASIHTHDRR
ncbi:hypothetical protein EAS54_18885 [Bradyrhizobium guangzhouense]|nr:hypothetical protein EAS54_18885 [Bradyrhizobium guangzhouense]